MKYLEKFRAEFSGAADRGAPTEPPKAPSDSFGGAVSGTLQKKPTHVDTSSDGRICPSQRGGRALDAELRALVDIVGRLYAFTPDEFVLARNLALADREAALQCYRHIAAGAGLTTPRSAIG
ncbi:MAG: hypothetical protein ING90_08610 [Rhodocyclaceae bacterium]|nr:hypothetical protein [Rhodocyclaceae bacterium]MCA3074187.1 hypothetical protein [Rhodocyclaceae bacterium]MCA3095092.1 hypothetical protein [Rhodocyclaceae bacterium]MCA3099435.1 hypothetical protein [Rhodocyclaceae bacterium]MCA3102822.1 hypothetical protein [Rhodocyclaceae bacterium]